MQRVLNIGVDLSHFENGFLGKEDAAAVIRLLKR